VNSPQLKRVMAELNPARHKMSLIPISSDQNWGKASSAIVQAVYDKNIIAMISLDRASSHLAEQIGIKAFVPVIALSSDRALTSINIPWIFRMAEGTSLESAVRTLAAAVDRAGPNRAKVRDVLASGASLANASFQSTGEPAGK
jgi:branched-chain amino acid transport system substrate-binding protein